MMTATSKPYRHRWTPEEDDYVRVHYEGTFRSCEAIARVLERTPYAVKARVSTLGLAKITDRKPWTAAEVDRLQILLEQYAVLTVARKMKRSVNAVSVKAKVLGFSRRNRSGWYTKAEVCTILGKDHKWVQRRIDDGSLEASWHNGRHPRQPGSGMWHIGEKSLKAFIRRYPDELNGRNVDFVAIVDILAGITYDT